MKKDEDLFSSSSSEDGNIIFRNVNGNPHTPINIRTGKVAFAEDDGKKRGRIKVAEITSPIYDDMVLSNGRRVKDIVTRAVEMPLTGSAGLDHIEDHPERKGMVEKYIGFMSEIINDPDYVFEDKVNDNSLVLGKEIEKDVFIVVSLNFDNPNNSNSIITMWSGNSTKMEKKYEKLGKVLYKKKKQ